MSVRQSLLAILAQGPCYGYQLRHEFDRRTGATHPLNVGQIYNTLERLERDGLVVRGAADEHGHVYWEITETGVTEVELWLRSPLDRERTTRDELAVKLAVAMTLPGADAEATIAAQRSSSAAQLMRLRDLRASRETDSPEGLAWSLIIDSMLFAAEAELRWIDHAADQLARHPQHALALELTAERPKRGRPARSAEGLPA